MKHHQKLYISSLFGTILFYGFILWICFHFPIIVVVSILTFFWFFYNREIKSFFSFSKTGILLFASISLAYADLEQVFSLLSHKDYKTREKAYEYVLKAGKINPYPVLEALKTWEKHPDLEIQFRVKKLKKVIKCFSFDIVSPPLPEKILTLVRNAQFEEADAECRTFKKNRGYDERVDISFLHEQISKLCYLRSSFKSDLESQFKDISKKAICYHNLYLFFLSLGENRTLFADQALNNYQERISAGPMQPHDDLKKILLFASCLNHTLEKSAEAEKLFQQFEKTPGLISPFHLGFYYTTIKDKEKAFALLLEAIDKEGYPAWIKIINSYYFISLQSDPRFDLIYELKGDEEWKKYQKSNPSSEKKLK